MEQAGSVSFSQLQYTCEKKLKIENKNVYQYKNFDSK